MRTKWKFRIGIAHRVTIPITTIMAVQLAIIVVTIVFGSTFDSLNKSAVNSFESKVQLRSNYVESNMVSWGNINSDYDGIKTTLETHLTSKNITTEQLLNSNNESVEALSKISYNMNLLLRKNNVTDAFIILNNSGTQEENNGIYIMDRNPEINSANNADILIEIAPRHITDELLNDGYDLSVSYSTRYKANDYMPEFYARTIEIGNNNLDTSPHYLGLWSNSFNIHGNSSITYQMPLIIHKKVIGVVGVGLSTSYFSRKMLNYSGDLGNFGLIKGREDTLETISMTYEDSYIQDSSIESVSATKYEGLSKIEYSNNKVFYVYVAEVNLYSDSVAHQTEPWCVVSLISDKDLFGANSTIITQLLFVISLCLIVGIIAELLICYVISRPIIKVSNQLKTMEIENINKTNIKEVDQLVGELKKYFARSIELPNRLNRILALADVNIGAFEYSYEDNTVSITDKFYEILNIEQSEKTCTIKEFEDLLLSVHKVNERKDEDSSVFYIPEVSRWVRLKRVENEGYISGVVQDITREVYEKQQVEIERDYDVLTGLLNRRGFSSSIKKIWATEGESAIMMLDLDNLKYINDKYGHDFGDDYISLVASEIKSLTSENIITCHLSGDEFLIYAFGFNSKKDILKIFDKFNKSVRELSLNIYGERIVVRLSSGIAFNDESISSIEELRKRAEFAMYEVKTNQKNGSAIFSLENYNSTIKNLELVEKFNDLVNQRLVRFAFQPIVDIKTSEIFGYEALMRPIDSVFKAPIDVLNMAKRLKRLGDIESLTINMALESFQKTKSDKRLFINSISSQALTTEQFNEIKDKYRELVKRTVIEITEEEAHDQEVMQIKLNHIKQIGSQIAIDDYGTGYNNLSMILNYNSKFIKLERSLIRHLDTDDKKYNLVKSIIDYCHNYDIEIIAECVETFEELKAFYDLGVNYVQGYIIQKPDFEIKPLSDDVLALLKKLKA